MDTTNPTRAIRIANIKPKGPANRLILKEGKNPPRELVIGFSITLGRRYREKTKLNSVAIVGINFSIFLESVPKSGIENEKPNGTAISNIGSSISRPPNPGPDQITSILEIPILFNSDLKRVTSAAPLFFSYQESHNDGTA